MPINEVYNDYAYWAHIIIGFIALTSVLVAFGGQKGLDGSSFFRCRIFGWNGGRCKHGDIFRDHSTQHSRRL